MEEKQETAPALASEENSKRVEEAHMKELARNITRVILVALDMPVANSQKRIEGSAVTVGREIVRLVEELNSTRHQKVFDLLELPSELREMIYGYALINNGVVLVERHSSTRQLQTASAPNRSKGPWYLVARVQKRAAPGNASTAFGARHASNLLLVSRAVHKEALPSLYSHNTFSFKNQHALDTFLNCVGNESSLLRSVIVQDCRSQDRGSVRSSLPRTLLQIGSQVCHITLVFERSDSSLGTQALDCYRSVQPFILGAYSTEDSPFTHAEQRDRLNRVKFATTHQIIRRGNNPFNDHQAFRSHSFDAALNVKVMAAWEDDVGAPKIVNRVTAWEAKGLIASFGLRLGQGM